MIVTKFTQRVTTVEDASSVTGQHMHCIRCRRRECTQMVDNLSSCAVVSCEACGWRCHACKSKEHKITCPEERVQCVNTQYGCPKYIKRRMMASHLPVCPASVVVCVEEWSRWPMHSADKGLKASIPRSKTYLDCGQLDVGLAMRDQRLLVDANYAPKTLRRSLRNSLTQKHPAVPLVMSKRSSSIESDMELSTETSETTSDDDLDVPWNLSRAHPGLRDSITSKLFMLSKETTENLATTLSNQSIANKDNSSVIRSDDVALGSTISNSGDARSMSSPNVERLIRRSESSERTSDGSARSSSVLRDFGGTQFLKVIGLNPSQVNESDIRLHNVLAVHLNYECINKFIAKHKSMYTFMCSQNFRRDEFVWHFKNVHQEIHQGLSGWIEQRCPLAYQGCTFSYQRIVPANQNTSLYHSWLHESFGLKSHAQFYNNNNDKNQSQKLEKQFSETTLTEINNEETATNVDACIQNDKDFSNSACPSRKNSTELENVLEPSLSDKCRENSPSESVQVQPVIYTAANCYSKVLFHYNMEEIENQALCKDRHSLNDLPFEILQRIGASLDSFSLRSLSLTCRKLRDVCCSLLDSHGIVLLNWRKKFEDGRWSWKVADKRWFFSTSFEPIRSWKFNDNHLNLSEHLKVCAFNQDLVKHEKPFNLTTLT